MFHVLGPALIIGWVELAVAHKIVDPSRYIVLSIQAKMTTSIYQNVILSVIFFVLDLADLYFLFPS